MKLEFENIEEMINFLSGLGYTIIKNGEPWMPYNPYPCVPYFPATPTPPITYSKTTKITL